VDGEALGAFHLLSSIEGIIPALESSHAVARAMVEAAGLPDTSIIVVNLSGRGDKDLGIVSRCQSEDSARKEGLS